MITPILISYNDAVNLSRGNADIIVWHCKSGDSCSFYDDLWDYFGIKTDKKIIFDKIGLGFIDTEYLFIWMKNS